MSTKDGVGQKRLQLTRTMLMASGLMPVLANRSSSAEKTMRSISSRAASRVQY